MDFKVKYLEALEVIEETYSTLKSIGTSEKAVFMEAMNQVIIEGRFKHCSVCRAHFRPVKLAKTAATRTLCMKCRIKIKDIK